MLLPYEIRVISSYINLTFLGTISDLDYGKTFIIWLRRVALIFCYPDVAAGLTKLRGRVVFEY